MLRGLHDTQYNKKNATLSIIALDAVVLNDITLSIVNASCHN